MKAAIRERYGPPDVVELRELDIPVFENGEVLVRVVAASVNRADLDGLSEGISWEARSTRCR